MRLLQVSLRSLLLYSIIVVVVSIPVSIFSIREILNEEVDEQLAAHTDQFLYHIKGFEYLDDLETDLAVLDQLTYDISIVPATEKGAVNKYETVKIYDSAENEFRPYRSLSSSVAIKGKPYLLTISMSLVDSDQLVKVLVMVQSIFIVVLAAGLLMVNRSMSKRLWKPFYNTINQLKAYELDKNESIQTDATNIVEFDDLNKAVSLLTDRSRKLYLQQKEFIENASHELQTPLAIFQSKLDNLMQSPLLTEAEASLILELEDTSKRMARLNKNLLLLSKIDNDQFTATEEIDLTAVINQLLMNLKPVADMDHIVVSTAIDTATIKANPSLVEVLLTNIFHNAIRHTTANGIVDVRLQGMTMEISNTGLPLTMTVEKMFERFSKESRNVNSTGLGLAIVKKICDTCGYALSYRYEEERHVFTVTF